MYLHFLWIAPVQAAAATLLLVCAIGPSSLAGMAVFFLLLPVQIVFGRLFSRLRSVARQHSSLSAVVLSVTPAIFFCTCIFRAGTAVLTDDRIRTMNEVISGIRVIKMYGWEEPFAALVDDMRR